MPGLIFVVDDDPAFTSQLDRILSSAGYRVVTELDGEHALKVLDQLNDSIDVAIVDFVIRGNTGFEIIGAIKRRPTRIKVLARLPPRGPDLSEAALSVGADLVVRRPRAGEPLESQKWLSAVRNFVSAA